MPSSSLVKLRLGLRLWLELRLGLRLRFGLGMRLGFISFIHSLDGVQILFRWMGGWLAGEMGIKDNLSQS